MEPESSCPRRTHGADGLLQLVALHRPAAVPVEGGEGSLPAVERLPQLPELVEAHGAGQVPLRPVKDPPGLSPRFLGRNTKETRKEEPQNHLLCFTF